MSAWAELGAPTGSTSVPATPAEGGVATPAEGGEGVVGGVATPAEGGVAGTPPQQAGASVSTPAGVSPSRPGTPAAPKTS
jgi:hypothetical protein